MATSTQRAAEGALRQGRERERYVEGLFDRISGPYDRLNRIMSLGRDRAWRRRLVEMADLHPGDRVLDIGTGTGDLALEFHAVTGPEGEVVGVDLSQGMLEHARRKRGESPRAGLSFIRANASRTGCISGWADAVSMGWCLRNVGERGSVYREILRVLAPGGRFVCIDMSRPRGWLARIGFWMFRHLALRMIVRLAGGDREAYRYLALSTDRFPDAPGLEDELREAGFKEVRHRSVMLGAVALHVGHRPPATSTPAGGGRSPR